MAKIKPKTLKCSTRRFQIQNDLREWEIDKLNKSVKVINEKLWNMKGISIDPLDIPKTKISLDKVTIVKDKNGNDVQVVEKLDLETTIKAATDAEKAKRIAP